MRASPPPARAPSPVLSITSCNRRVSGYFAIKICIAASHIDQYPFASLFRHQGNSSRRSSHSATTMEYVFCPLLSNKNPELVDFFTCATQRHAWREERDLNKHRFHVRRAASALSYNRRWQNKQSQDGWTPWANFQSSLTALLSISHTVRTKNVRAI